MATVSVEIDGTPVVIQYESLSIDERIEERSTASFTVIDTAGSGSHVRGEPIEIFNGTPATIFTGFIDTPDIDELTPSFGLLHDIKCIDNHYLADKRLVVKSYTDKTLEYIVEDILTDYLADEGITEGEIQTGPTISEAIFNYVKVAEAFDALKELSGFIWDIDKDKKLYFIDRATNLAPWDLDGSVYKPIEGSEHLSLGNPLYRNRQYVRGGKGQTSEQTETFTGDGVTVAFTVGYPLAVVPTVTVQDRVPEAQTIGIKGIDTGKSCYWSKSDATIIFDIAPENGKTVTIIYYGEYPLIVRADDYAGVVARQAIEGGTGIVEEIITEAQHETDDAMLESARAKLLLYCRDAERFTYQTRDSGLAPGQLQAITHSPFGFSAHEMLIEAVSINADAESIIYTVTCITGPVMGSWSKFFANILSRQDKQIKIGDSLLLVLLQQSEELDLAEATDIDTDDFSGGIVNRWMNTPPIDTGSLTNVEHEVLALAEVPSSSSHATADYEWDDGTKWGFGTWA